MKRRVVLVPFDGSTRAEAALPYAERLAATYGLGIELLTVVNCPSDGPDVAQLRALVSAGLQVRLERIAERLRASGLTVEPVSRVGDPAEVILARAEKLRCQAVVMTTRGLGPLAGRLIGSVVDRVLRLAPCPVLVVRPGDPAQAPVRWQPHRLLVPLDGLPPAEAALMPAFELAATLDAEVVLARVQPWTALPVGGAGGSVPDLAQLDAAATHHAADYLRAVSIQAPAGVVLRDVVLRGNPAERLIEFAHADRIDLVVISSHRRSDVERLVLGSVTDRLISHGPPALIIRPVTWVVETAERRDAAGALV